jgi:hypothetical protein
VHTIRTAPGSFYIFNNKLNLNTMAGNPKTKSSTAPKSGRPMASTKGAKVGVNPKATTKSTAVMKLGGMMKGKKSC